MPEADPVIRRFPGIPRSSPASMKTSEQDYAVSVCSRLRGRYQLFRSVHNASHAIFTRGSAWLLRGDGGRPDTVSGMAEGSRLRAAAPNDGQEKIDVRPVRKRLSVPHRPRCRRDREVGTRTQYGRDANQDGRDARTRTVRELGTVRTRTRTVGTRSRDAKFRTGRRGRGPAGRSGRRGSASGPRPAGRSARWWPGCWRTMVRR
jgi:hypothetical protein